MELLNRLSQEAASSPRLRKNFNLHPSDDFCCHRLFNAIEPGSYVRPHRHLDPAKDETMVTVRGRLGVVVFDDTGVVLSSTVIGPRETSLAVDIPHGVFHTVVGLEKGTVFFEAKAGPFLPLAEEEKGGWAPAEGDPEAASYLMIMEDVLKRELE
ncbi:MAG TPA: WbuC family cupin fold metalloprotein [Geobacteraceae bacterium]